MKLLKKIYKTTLSENVRTKINICISKFKIVMYVGNNVTCNCCNKTFKKFSPYGDRKIKRLNARCLNCLSLERTRMLWHFLINSSYLKGNNRILHFAPEKIIESHLKSNHSIKYISADINPNLAMEKVDITNIQFKESSFDLIICSHVLSVVKNDGKALKEMHRVLNKSGSLILMEHIYSEYEKTLESKSELNKEERTKIYGASYLERCYGKDFKLIIGEAGFKVEVIDYPNFINDKEVEKFGLQNSGLIFLCSKIKK